MSFKLHSHEIKLTEGYAVLRCLSPVDKSHLNTILGDKKDDEDEYERAMVASSIVKLICPDYENYSKEQYMKVDEDKPHNFIKDPNDPTKEIPHPLFPDNYVLDKTKSREIVYKTAKTHNDLIERMQMSWADWAIVSQHALKINQPNPYLLGE